VSWAQHSGFDLDNLTLKFVRISVIAFLRHGESKHRHRPESLGMFRPKNATLSGNHVGIQLFSF
jgi:hypothetical protein